MDYMKMWSYLVPLLILVPCGSALFNFHGTTNNVLEYDFIIVGSGSSGAVIANRLSEVPTWKVLLIEAGNRGNHLTSIPIVAPLFQLTPYNWNYTMEPQDGVCTAMEEHRCAWPRGKAIGGSTVINYMIYTRGNPKDYDKWASGGLPEWSYDNVLPYYLKSENCRLNHELCASSYHQKGGYLSVSYPFRSKLTDAFLQAGRELGVKMVDYNSADFMGYGQIQATLKHGRRDSVADAFIYPFLRRANLKVLHSSRVTKLLLAPGSKQVIGVEFWSKGRKYLARARKEVVLSAGAFHSPQLLMLSGIGPQEHLKELGIPLVHNLPVGQQLYDHISYPGLAFTINRTLEPRESLLYPWEIVNFLFNGTGPYTSLGGIEALAYINTGSIPDPGYPDIELIFSGGGALSVDFGLVAARELRIRRDVYNKVFKPLEPKPTWTILPMLLHPKSRGFLKLRSRNPFDSPKFYGRYFTDESDLDTLLAAIRYIQKLAKTPAFQKYDSQIHTTPIPGCESFDYDSDSYWKCALRSLTTSLHHQISTCKMGVKDDPSAVVDARLRVHGIQGLRVADTSVIPVTLSAHTSAPAIMVGERAADFIKKDWKP